MDNMWKFNWFVAFVVGMIPLFSRFLACLLNKGFNLDFNYIFNAVDISLLGLAMNWTNIVEVQHISAKNKRKKKLSDEWISTFIFLTGFLIFLLGGVILALYSSELNSNGNITQNAIWIASLLTIVSVIMSFFYIKKINTL